MKPEIITPLLTNNIAEESTKEYSLPSAVGEASASKIDFYSTPEQHFTSSDAIILIATYPQPVKHFRSHPSNIAVQMLH